MNFKTLMTPSLFSSSTGFRSPKLSLVSNDSSIKRSEANESVATKETSARRQMINKYLRICLTSGGGRAIICLWKFCYFVYGSFATLSMEVSLLCLWKFCYFVYESFATLSVVSESFLSLLRFTSTCQLIQTSVPLLQFFSKLSSSNSFFRLTS